MKEKIISNIALNTALKEGASQVRITYYKSESDKFTVADNNLDKLEHNIDNSLSIQLFVNGKYGSYSTNNLENEQILKFIKEAIEMTNAIAKDECRILPDRSLYFTGSQDDLGQFFPMNTFLSPEEKIAIAKDCCNEMYGKNDNIIYTESSYSDCLTYQYMTDSNGFSQENAQTEYCLYAECTLLDNKGARPVGWEIESSMNNLETASVGKRAMQIALSKLNPQKIAKGKKNVIIDSRCSSKFVSPILSALNGRSIIYKHSFLMNKEGKKIFPDIITLEDNPLQYGMSGSRFFDDEGMRTQLLKPIENGVIKSYYIDTYSSKKLNLSPTNGSPSVPKILPCSTTGKICKTSEEMIKQIDNGIIITGINGGNCNNTTGDFSFGFEGFEFKEGKILHPINEMNITGNIISLWQNVIMAGNDAKKYSDWQIPSLAFHDINIT